MIANLIRTLIIELFKRKLKMTIQDIQSLAEAHGLLLTDKMNFNEMGIDFKVVLLLIQRGNNGCCVFLVVMA